MTNKPMLSVERKVIEDILADAREPGTDYKAARKVLRALLDKPVLKSWPCWSCKTHITLAERAEADGECPHCEAELDLDDWPIEPAARHQGEPVAYQIRRRTDREDSAWTKWQECSEMERAMHSHEVGKYNRFGIMREIRALYAEQPAPVAVVMAGQLNTCCDPGCPYRGEPKCCRELVEARNRVKP